MMSEADRRVLRSRRHFISASVHLDEDLLDDLREHRLITCEQTEMLKDQALSNNERNMRLVEELLESPSFSLATFCKCIDHYPSLVEELQADLRAEIGVLEIEEHVRREAASMVHKRFGTSRRFSESDKRQIASMIAYKSQIAKETARRHVISLTAELEKLKDVHKKMEMRLHQLNSRIRLFIKQNELDTMDRFYDLRTTSDVLKGSQADTEPPDTISQLEERVYLLMNKFIRVLAEKEGLVKRGERKNVPNEENQKDSKICRNGYSNCERQRRPGMVGNITAMSERDGDHCDTYNSNSSNGNTALAVRPLLWFGDRKNSYTPSETEKQLLAAIKGLKRKINLLEEELNLRDIEVESLKAEIRHRDQEVASLRNMLYHSAVDTHSVETHCDIIGRMRRLSKGNTKMISQAVVVRSQEDSNRKQSNENQLPPLLPKNPAVSTTPRPGTRHSDKQRQDNNAT